MLVDKKLSSSSKGYNVDDVVAQLQFLGRTARRMPRSFDSDGVTYKVHSPDSGGEMARMLPGRGVLVGTDLHRLGITRQPRYVYDPTRYRRIEDEVVAMSRRESRYARLLAERGQSLIQGAAITSYDDVISARGAGKDEDRAFQHLSLTTVATVWSSLWRSGGQPPAGTFLATTAPTDANLDNSNSAAISKYLSNPAGTDKKYLLTFGYGSGQQINWGVLVDIINHGGSFRASVATAETVVTPTITGQRQYGTGSGVGNLLTFIVATAGTPGAGTFIAQYVNQAGSNVNAPTLTVAATALTANCIFTSQAAVTAGAGSFFVPLAAGDTGVQAVKQTTFSVAGTGVLASNVFYPLSFMPGVGGNTYQERDSTIQIDGIMELANVSQVIGHLALYVLPNGTSSGALVGFLRTVSG